MSYDPYDHLGEDDRHDWEMRTWLAAQRRLRDLEERGHRRTQLFDRAEHGERCCRAGCQAAGVRLVRLTGDLFCPAHDPLAAPHWGRPCCVRKED